MLLRTIINLKVIIDVMKNKLTSVTTASTTTNYYRMNLINMHCNYCHCYEVGITRPSWSKHMSTLVRICSEAHKQPSPTSNGQTNEVVHAIVLCKYFICLLIYIVNLTCLILRKLICVCICLEAACSSNDPRLMWVHTNNEL